MTVLLLLVEDINHHLILNQHNYHHFGPSDSISDSAEKKSRSHELIFFLSSNFSKQKYVSKWTHCDSVLSNSERIIVR